MEGTSQHPDGNLTGWQWESSILMARDSPDRFQKLNERPDRKVEALLLWLLEETPGSARKLIPWALRDWARHGVNKASNHRGEEADTAESACDQAKVKILR